MPRGEVEETIALDEWLRQGGGGGEECNLNDYDCLWRPLDRRGTHWGKGVN